MQDATAISSLTIPTISEFDSLRRGAPAPDWVVDGICSSWVPATLGVEVVLITVSENVTFRVSTRDGRRMVVRLQRPGYVDVASVRSELQWIDAITTETDVKTPAPIRGTDGEFTQSLRGPNSAAWTAVAFEFAEGRILEDHDADAKHFTQIGRITAALHQHSRGWRRPPGFMRFNWESNDMVGPTARWGDWRSADLSDADRRMMLEAQRAAQRVLDITEKSPRTWGLIHADLRPSNIMVDDESLTVIDFDDAGDSWFLYDFASAITFYEHRAEAPAMAANWLLGYSEVCPLSRAERDVAAALSMMRRLTMLGWATTHRSDALPADLWNENLPGTVEVAARYLDNPLWLVDP